MAKLKYNNAKNTSTSHTLFGLNYSYPSYVFFQDKVYQISISCFVNKMNDKMPMKINVNLATKLALRPKTAKRSAY